MEKEKNGEQVNSASLERTILSSYIVTHYNAFARFGLALARISAENRFPAI